MTRSDQANSPLPRAEPGASLRACWGFFESLGKIAKLEVFETETFPAEEVETFLKVLV